MQYTRAKRGKKNPSLKESEPCGNCSGLDHQVRDCHGPTNGLGYIDACPVCNGGHDNSRYHVIDDCPRLSQDPNKRFKDLIVNLIVFRSEKPPVASRTSLATLRASPFYQNSPGPIPPGAALARSNAGYHTTFNYSADSQRRQAARARIKAQATSSNTPRQIHPMRSSQPTRDAPNSLVTQGRFEHFESRIGRLEAQLEALQLAAYPSHSVPRSVPLPLPTPLLGNSPHTSDPDNMSILDFSRDEEDINRYWSQAPIGNVDTVFPIGYLAPSNQSVHQFHGSGARSTPGYQGGEGSVRQYQGDVVSVRRYQGDEGSVRQYQGDVGSVRVYQDDVASIREWQGGVASVREFQGDDTSVREYQGDEESVRDFQGDDASVREYQGSVRAESTHASEWGFISRGPIMGAPSVRTSSSRRSSPAPRSANNRPGPGRGRGFHQGQGEKI